MGKKCWKSQGILSVQKSGNHDIRLAQARNELNLSEIIVDVPQLWELIYYSFSDLGLNKLNFK